MTQLLYRPYGLFVSNGEIYIADTNNHRVRKVLQNGQIVTICGTGIQGYNGDGQLATDAQLNLPWAVVVSSSNQVYISEMDGDRIRKIDPCGIISTIAGTEIEGYNGDDQLATNARVNFPCGLFVTDDEHVLFADCLNHRVRMIDRNGIISTLAGNGVGGFNGDGQLATSASLYYPSSVFQYKNEIYITDTDNQRIRKMDQNGIISTVVGNEGYDTSFNPDSVSVHNGQVYLSEAEFNLIRKVLPNGCLLTIAGIEGEQGFNGNDMSATKTKLNNPRGIFIDTNSQIYIADCGNHCIRMIDRNGMMKIIAGTAGHSGYSGDVPFDFEKYPHIGPKKKQLIKPFPLALFDLIVKCQ